MSPSFRQYLLRSGLVLALALMAAPARAGDIAVVTHPDVPIADLSFTELRRILRGDRQFWEPGRPVSLIVRAPEARERTILLTKIYKMSESQFRQYWISKVFRAQAAEEPRLVLSNDESAELVSVLSGAVALIDADDLPEGLKVLTVDGLKPGDGGYPLSD